MRQILAKVLVLVGLCGVFVVSWNCKGIFSSGETEPDIRETCRPEPSEIDFGLLPVGASASDGVQLKNVLRLTGACESTVRIDSFSIYPYAGGSSLDCDAAFSIEPSTALIREDSTADFTVHFEPTERGEVRCFAMANTISSAYPTSCNLPYLEPCQAIRLLGVGGMVEPECGLSPTTEYDFGEVMAGAFQNMTMTIRNENPDSFEANRFRYLFENPSEDCRLFTIDPADAVGVLGPGESKEIAVRFEPDAAGSFECSRTLSSLKEPADAADPAIANACPTEVIWRGTRPAGSLAWSDCSQVGFDYDLNGLYGLSENEIYLAGVLGNVLRSDGSCDWDLAGTPFAEVNLTDIWAHSTASDTAIWAVGNLVTNSTTGAILRSDGSTWEKVDEGWMVHYGAVWGSALDNVYFVGTGVSTDLANTKYWNGSVIDTLTIDMGWTELTSVHGTASDDVWAVVQQSLMSNSVYRFQGTTWENQTLPVTPNPLHDVWALQGTGFYAVYAVGEDGAIYHYDGSSWADESITGETDDFYGVWVSETGQAWVVGQNGAIYHKSGANWTLQNPPVGLERDLRDVWGSSDENVFAVGADGLILRYAR